MTNVAVPDFIIKLYEDETRKVLNTVINHICHRFSLEKSAVTSGVEKNINLKLEIVPDDDETLIITKKTPKPPPDEDERCVARLKKNGVFVQCLCVRNDNFELDMCTRHSNAFHQEKLKYGTINDPIPDENLKRKARKIY